VRLRVDKRTAADRIAVCSQEGMKLPGGREPEKTGRRWKSVMADL
jgi:hypothetical protein